MMGCVAMTLVSCSNTEFNQPTAQEGQKVAQYTEAFTGAFGGVNANVNWGFDAAKVLTLDQNGSVVAKTAARTRRVANVNRNEWGTGNGNGGHVQVPVNVTPDERTLVYNYFNRKREGAVNQYNIKWTDFFVSQVWKGSTVYKDGNGSAVVGSDKMNHLQCSLQLRANQGSIDANGSLAGSWEHINDFNNGSQWSGYGTIEGHTYMQNSGTCDFAYHNSVDSKYHNEYIIIPGAEIDASLAGYYYVGFDFYATHPVGQEANKNMDVARDWYFTDWILRISPADFLYGRRIMAEDLIASSLTNVDKSDLDFNDVVFDIVVLNEWVAAQNANKRVAHITLRAAGGTKPLYLGQLDPAYEVHKLLGVDNEKTMINTHAQAQGEYKAQDGVAPVQFTVILGDADWNSSYNYADFPIYVGGELLVAPLGKATHKLCVPTSTKWMNEKVIISTGYPKFTEYVNNGTPADWYTTTGSGLYE